MKNNNIKVFSNDHADYRFLSALSMISSCFLMVAMIFTYRIIEFGPFLTPGGVIPFAITYLIAAIITEVYGYKNAKKTIYGNFICIFIFNITVDLLLKIPVPSNIVSNESFSNVFNHAILVMLVYSTGFLFGDLMNAYFVSKWKVLLKGRYFFIRLIGASIIGQISFSLVVIPSLYSTELSPEKLTRQFVTTIAAKILVIVILSYPGAIVVNILKKLERIPCNRPKVLFNPF